MLITQFGQAPQVGYAMQLGQVVPSAAEDALAPALTNQVTGLVQQENQLRITFAQLLPDLTVLQNANQDIPSEVLALMQAHNNAVAAFMEASKVWLQARADTPSSDLPDPGAQAIAIPTFDIPTASLGRFFAAAVPASTLKIRHGIVGKEVSTSLGGYWNSPFAGYFHGDQLGLGPLGIAIAVLLGLAIVGATIVLTARFLQTSDTVAANQAITEQSKARVDEVKSDRDLFVSTRDACMGQSTDQDVRLKCIAAAKDVLKTAKEGRPQAQKPVLMTPLGILSIVGGLALIGGLSYAGYRIYKRRKGHSPRAAHITSFSVDEDNEY